MRLSLLVLPILLSAQDAAPVPELTAPEKQFQESMNNVTMVGFFTMGDSKDLHEDKYVIERVTKERFAEARKPRKTATEGEASSGSRHIPSAIKRAVFERDGSRCTFTDERGRRCGETGGLEFDHLDGFARTHLHDADRIRLLNGLTAAVWVHPVR